MKKEVMCTFSKKIGILDERVMSIQRTTLGSIHKYIEWYLYYNKKYFNL
ncbi:hypothetical protein [Abyssisolibacter fermentans]|nr:hypothetical protein [Abyssisolibacter fermentans]